MNEYHRCLICLGSNHKGVAHLKEAEKELKELACDIHWGNVIETIPEGTVSSCLYQNRAAVMYTSLDKEVLVEEFKRIEGLHGRTASDKEKGIIPLDIDLLVYDEEIVKPADLKKGYVQQALQSVVQ